MTAIIKGHGARIDDMKTFVPQGVTIKFYSRPDVNLATVVALTAMVDEARASATETINGTGVVGDVDNYILGAQDDRFYAQWLALGGKSSIPIWWVGNDIPDGTRLCENPETCNGLGEHTCTGALGLVDDREIIILACRGYVGNAQSPLEKNYGTDPGNPLQSVAMDRDELVTHVLAQAKFDPAVAEQYVDSLDQAMIAMLITRTDFANWQLARQAKEYAAANNLEQLFGHLRANQGRLGGIMQWQNDVPSYASAVDTVAASYPDTFAAWLYQYDDQIRQSLMARPAVSAALSRLSAET